MTACLIGLGSNLGDRPGHLHAAINALRSDPTLRVEQISSLYESAPSGGSTGQRNYLNAAATLTTDLPPRVLLARLLGVEQSLGRIRTEKWGPRTIDLDLLLFGEAEIDDTQASIPHPRMHERRFVLAPAAEIAGTWRHPVLHKSISQLLAELPPPKNREMGIRIVHNPRAMTAAVEDLRRTGRRVGLVPTMGALHAGHISLVQEAKRRCDAVTATIFVNPTQFAPHEDLAKYPRTLDADLDALSAAGCDLCFVPAADDIYPPGFSTFVEPPAVAQPLEGICRPGHFRGVATIVLKLFHLVPADVACFGEKDYQQLQVIRHMVRDLNLPIEIVPCPTVREPDGLAMSSRNRYLSPAERQQALTISQALERAAQLAAAGARQTSALEEAMHAILREAKISRVDYAVVVDPHTLLPKNSPGDSARALIAAYVGSTRLIDNRAIEFT